VSKVSANDSEEEPLLTALLSVNTTPLFHEIHATMSSGLLSKERAAEIAFSAVLER
jgi:hypothetical protein